ncbi:MAG: tRNA epoxyqueuosine(34) reductase QueG [Dehalococcoidia bacterium]|nr:tRNA epoxyqueuosine(34) reductase QueG [Dehalococcoidia bacterium]
MTAPATTDALQARVLSLLQSEGFDFVGVAPSSVLHKARAAALAAHEEGRLHGLHWMTPTWLERATDPARFLPGARSVILVALPCHPPEPDRADETAAAPTRGRVARYAWRRDYHRTFEKKLRRLARALRSELGASARPTVDYGPLLERPLAASAGLGWLGKSTMLLVPDAGPWVLLGAIATSLALPPGRPLRKSCGACTRCLTACPTGALAADGARLDSRLCISYHTIENRGPIPRGLRPFFGDWIFGCDACLDACPVGARSRRAHPDFVPATVEDARPALAPLLSLDAEAFADRFRGRAIMRAGRDGFLRNVCVALGNVGVAADLPALLAALDDPAPLVRGHAAWALGALGRRLGLDPTPLQQALNHSLAREADPSARDELQAAVAVLAAPPGREDPACDTPA